jgi:hypothetical protein
MAWEFAYHILHKQANLVILLMAWLTPQHLSVYSAKSKEPDMDILAYWIARLEPLVRAEDEGEIIVVLTNRCGTEGEAIYAGTSCVLGIEDGEVKVYGVLGRGNRDLLVVDTSEPPQYNLVAKPDTEIQGQTAESHNTSAIEYDELADRESIDPDTAREGQGLTGSIDAVLAEGTAFLRNQHQQKTVYAYMDAEMPRVEELPGDFTSSIPASDSQSPSTSISSSIASSVCEIEGLPSVSSRTNTLDSPTVPEERRQEMVQISRPDSLEPGIYGFRNGNPSEPTSSMEVNASCKSGPSVSRAEDIHRSAIASSNRQVVPILTTQVVYSWNSSYLLDSGYPSKSAHLLDSAYPPDSAFHTDSAHPPESVYLPESASSTTVNVPWELEQNRSYYGDEELTKIMKVDTPGARNSRHKLTHVGQLFVSPIDNQPDSASPPDAAYPPDPARPPESATSTTVNVPWEPESNRSYYKDIELIKTRRVPSPLGAANSRYDSISIPQPFVSSIDNPTDSAYLLDFACPPDSAYPPESAASMIVNVPWEPQPSRSYYGDEELTIVMKAPAPSWVSDSNHESTAAAQLFISPTENLLDPACSIIVNKAYTLEPSLIGSKNGGVTKIMNYDTSTRSILSATDDSPESGSSMRVNTSSSRNLSPFDPRRDRIIQITANTSIESSIGHTSFESTEYIVSPTENQLESAASVTVNTGWEPNSAKPVVSQTDNPREPAISLIVNAALESSLTQSVVTPIENPPDSACSIMFNMPLVPSPGLFPGEDFVSPMATSKTSSSGHMSFPIVQPTSSSADLLQSPMSDLSMKYSDNSPISPESASSMLVNPSWDASPTFSTIEKIIKFAEPPSSPVASLSSHESLPVAEPVSPPKERPLSPKLRNNLQTADFQGNAALLFEELANQLEGASAATHAEVLRACSSPHLTPDPPTNAIHNGGLFPSQISC